MYDFSQINDKEFETLCCDLIAVEVKARIERFKAGADSGVDGRFFHSGNECILQCKHYLKSGFAKLLSVLERTELPKVQKLNPKRYIVATSVTLSRANKSKIKRALSPFVLSDSDIYGQEDLNGILESQPQIEERHFKLWITSTTVLKIIVNAAINQRSKLELERIQSKAHKYVETACHVNAAELLESKNVLIVTGEPGVGKTSLAENIALSLTAKGYEFYEIQTEISEAESVLDANRKQVFLFDDFLGSNYFEAIENKRDSHISKFISHIEQSKNKKLILTSRTNILNNGIIFSPVLKHSHVRKSEFIIEVSAYSDMDRARILYNHIWYSDLSEEQIDQIYQDKKYYNIINHKNFNPRLVEFITDYQQIPVEYEKNYWKHIERNLENPKEVWADSFRNQCNEFVRILVSLCVYNGGNIREVDLNRSFSTIVKMRKIESGTNVEMKFEQVSRMASKYFLNRNWDTKEYWYSLFNPSIADFIIEEYSSDAQFLFDIFSSLGSGTAIAKLSDLEINGKVSKELCSSLYEKLFLEFVGYNVDYKLRLCEKILDMEKHQERALKTVVELFQGDFDGIDEERLFHIATEHKDNFKDLDFKKIRDKLSEQYLSNGDIDSISKFLDKFPDKWEIFEETLADKLNENLKEDLEFSKDLIDLGEYVSYRNYEDGDSDIDVDTNGITLALSDLTSTSADEIESEHMRNLVDIDQIVATINIDSLADSYSTHEDDETNQIFKGNFQTNSGIDDLFQRG